MNGGGYANGEVGMAFNFVGGNEYLMVQPTNSALNIGGGTGFTIEAWINPTELSSARVITEYERVLGTDSGSDVGLDFSINDSGISPRPGCLAANIVDTNDVTHLISSAGGVVTNGMWQHVALTYDKSSGIGTLYVNGSVVAQASLGSFTPQTTFTNILTGRTTFNSVSSPNAAFEGGVDELSFYDRALSGSEIAAIYNAGSAGKCTSGLAPMIVTEPTNQTVAVGGTAAFSVTATGSAPLSYQWSSNGVSISGATNASLVLTNVALGWSGNTYGVQVSNAYGATNSASALLTVNGNSIGVTQRPVLGLSRSGKSWLFSWPMVSSNFVLESSPTLAPGSWTPVVSPPSLVGNQYQQSVQSIGTNQFYRLRFTSP